MLKHANDFTMIHSIKLTHIFRVGQSFIRNQFLLYKYFQFNILPYGQPCVFMKTKKTTHLSAIYTRNFNFNIFYFDISVLNFNKV